MSYCDNSPYKIFANSEPRKVFSGDMGTAKVFSLGGGMCAMDQTPMVNLSNDGPYMQTALPYAGYCRNNSNGETVCKKQ